MVIQSRSYTLSEFEAFIGRPKSKGRLFELIEGEIVEKMPTREHAIIAAAIATWLNNYLWQNNLGYAAVEARHHPEGDSKNDRLPDVSWVADTSKPIETQGSAPYMPDFCVEIKSPDDSYKGLRAKKDFYLAHGTQLVWLVFPEHRIVEWYATDDEGVMSEGDILDGRDLLPGFKLPVSEIFPKRG
jgi:Uma2 family endonuclease